jgi:hypothetical protein
MDEIAVARRYAVAVLLSCIRRDIHE